MLVIPATDAPRVVEHADYDAISAAVGGWLEPAPVDGDITIYVHEEGKTLGLPFNKAADDLWAEVFPVEDRHDGDFLVGSAAVLGGVDDDGNDTDVPGWVLERFGICPDCRPGIRCGEHVLP